MTRPPHVCPNKGCRGYALGSDDEQEGAQHHRRRGDEALVGAPKLLRSKSRKIDPPVLHPRITETPNFPHAFRRFTSCSPIEEFLRKAPTTRMFQQMCPRFRERRELPRRHCRVRKVEEKVLSFVSPDRIRIPTTLGG
jgi:hypothetical protein